MFVLPSFRLLLLIVGFPAEPLSCHHDTAVQKDLICFDVPARLASWETWGAGEPGHLFSLALACLVL